MSMTDTTTPVTRVGGEMGQRETDNLKVKLDLSLLIEGNISGKVLDAAKEIEPYAQALADHFGGRIRSNGIAVPVGYPVNLHVELIENLDARPRVIERTQVADWLNENVPVGDESFRWAIVPNGSADRIIVKLVKRRQKSN